jgi:hypothetical protein
MLAWSTGTLDPAPREEVWRPAADHVTRQITATSAAQLPRVTFRSFPAPSSSSTIRTYREISVLAPQMIALYTDGG